MREYLISGGEVMTPSGPRQTHPPPEYNCIIASRLNPSVKPWEWGVCPQWTRQDWFSFVCIANSVENEPGVRKVLEARAKRQQGNAGGGKSSTFVINRGEG